MNVDASWNDALYRGDLGWIVCDSRGCHISAGNKTKFRKWAYQSSGSLCYYSRRGEIVESLSLLMLVPLFSVETGFWRWLMLSNNFGVNLSETSNIIYLICEEVALLYPLSWRIFPFCI